MSRRMIRVAICGVSVVSMSVALPLRSQTAPPPRAVIEEMRIVSDESNPSMRLTRVSDLLVNDAGLIFLEQGNESLIRVFSPQGRLLRSFGRQGRGPGEWRGAFDLFGAIGDTVLVRDQNSWVINFYDATGRFLRALSPPAGKRTFAYLPGNRMLIELEFWQSVQRPGLRPGDPPRMVRTTRDSIVFAVVDAQGRQIRSVVRDSSRRVGDIAVRLPPVPGEPAGWVLRQPFVPNNRLLVEDPNGRRGFLVQSYNEFGGRPGQVKLITVGGNGMESERVISLEARRLARADIDAWVREWADKLEPSARKGGMPRANIEKQLRDSLRTADYLNPAEEVVVGRDGSVWFRPSWSKTDWSVVLAGNTPASTVRVPAGEQVLQAGATVFWAVRTDADGLPIVVRYRIAER